MHKIKEHKINIIILNWNGKDDTIACLKSIENIDYTNFEIIIVDNNSTDDSLLNIENYIKNKTTLKISIIKNDDNYGFAKANNIGIKKALENEAEYILLLNNDTEVTKEFLNELNNFTYQNPEYKVLTPQIRYYKPNNIIWNCGGRLNKWGITKYYYEGKHFNQLPDKHYINVSFITGCAMYINSEVLRNYGLLTEDFFFGEEDVEFSLRLRKHKIKTACILSSVIYHKVSSSVSKASTAISGKAYIHYLNRFINMKNYMNPAIWHIWRIGYLKYIIFLLILRHKVKFKAVKKFALTLLKESKRLNKVDKETFENKFSLNFEN